MEAKQGSDQQLEEQLALFGGIETQTRKGAAVRGTRNWSIAMQGARLGGYTEALWEAYPDMPRSADFVMFWWRSAADLVRLGKTRRFGLITTNPENSRGASGR